MYILTYIKMTDKKNAFPTYLSAINRKKKRVFVLAPPNLCAMRIGGVWQYSAPLTDRQMEEYEIVLDLELSLRFVIQAREALDKNKNEVN